MRIVQVERYGVFGSGPFGKTWTVFQELVLQLHGGDALLYELRRTAGIYFTVRCDGDVYIDDHHTVEGVAIAQEQQGSSSDNLASLAATANADGRIDLLFVLPRGDHCVNSRRRQRHTLANVHALKSGSASKNVVKVATAFAACFENVEMKRENN